jgi:SET domain-containing protein
MQQQHLYIHQDPLKGRGVYALKSFEIGELVEECPVLVLSAKDTERIIPTMLYDYYFEWGEDASQSAIALGYGSLYNHSYQANLSYEMDFEEACIRFYAHQKIAPGDELCINYGGTPNAQEELWFEVY